MSALQVQPLFIILWRYLIKIMLNTYNTISLSYKVTDTKNIPPPPPWKGRLWKKLYKVEYKPTSNKEITQAQLYKV